MRAHRLSAHRRSAHRPAAHALGLLLAASALSAQQLPDEATVPYRAGAPLGLPTAIPAPADNPLTREGFELGRKLFFDPILSIDRTVACASCHRPDAGFASPERFPPGVKGRHALRHAPTLYNRGFGDRQRWDGKASSLEEQVLLPIQDPNEMDLRVDDAIDRLRESSYRGAFERVFRSDVSKKTLARALASFVRGLTHADTPIDRFLFRGERDGLTVDERAGMWLWESKGKCWQCHTRPNYSDERFHNTGIGVVEGKPEPGRQAVTGDDADLGKFKTPTLRGLTETAPYMHDGSLATLEDVVAFYRRGGNPNSHLSPLLASLPIDDTEARQLVAFLRVLSRRSAPASPPRSSKRK